MAVLHSTQGTLPGDAALHHWSLTHRPGAAVTMARAVTATGTGVIPFAVVILAGLSVGGTIRQRVITAAAMALCLGSAQALRYAVMMLVARPRPPLADWATHASGWSFPSGHATTGAMTAGLLTAALFLRGPRMPRLAAVLIGIWGTAVGLTRVYLGVHWFSDVISGWLFATAWLALAACAYSVGTRRRPSGDTLPCPRRNE
ncbi:phosphatase PAP2 family protein [Streptomyces sp. NBC_00876]|uniref:phosphatase PAP2 family protein n=1 Tax=Streptomyces sp. NBC_00876 TaxID=2975853 RepID=UPI00386DC166|nr:phosphatase PAP2 family protein [Streptomyces sp. NBC_00876]